MTLAAANIFHHKIVLTSLVCLKQKSILSIGTVNPLYGMLRWPPLPRLYLIQRDLAPITLPRSFVVVRLL